MDLYFLHFNNYYNRIIKKFDTLSDYLTLPYYDNCMVQNAAFNPNDSVETVQIVNHSNFNYDYLVAAEGSTIVSRWFCMEAKRKRNGQYEIALRRDMFADNYPDILTAPAFIEKATLLDNDPMIFNKEDMTFNQIKTSETLLKDNSECSWIVGYLATTADMANSNTVVTKYPEVYAYKTTFETDWNGLKVNDNVLYNNKIINFSSPIIYNMLANNSNDLWIISSGGVSNNSSDYQEVPIKCSNVSSGITDFTNYFTNNTTIDNISNTYFNLASQNDLNSIMEYNGKVILDSQTNKYYKVNITQTYSNAITLYVGAGSLFNEISDFVSDSAYFSGTPNNNSFFIYAPGSIYSYTLIELSAKTVSYQFRKNDVNKLQDAPYLMFAIPYGKIDFSLTSETPALTLNISDSDAKSIGLAVANDIIENMGGLNPILYDIQLLPYCPFQDNILSDGTISFGDNKYYSKILDSNSNVVSLICWALYSKFTFNIPYSVSNENIKISSQCDFYRLCSPNWNGQFEFNADKNGGVQTINVDCDYKPFQPYIHLNPNFGLLYGQDFNDARGLVCNGDFSLAQISDAWATYQRQNVNYEKQFNRQIQNMEVNNNIQNIKTATSAVTNTVGGILGGLITGGIGGAIAGGAASAVGGVMDYALQKAGQAEAIDYTKDQFGYNLGNIKALPDSLTKVSAFNNNNKIWPVMEYYTCTDEEKQALKDKIKYNGMTVMRIGTIQEFLRSDLSYIKGKFIRLENVKEDFHYVNELANEFNKGVFIS